MTGTWRDLAAELGGAIDARGAERPEVALVLGSGLGAFADAVEASVAIGFDELPSMPRSTVPGHAGRFVVGRIEGVPVICQQGRVHLYEGHTAEVVARAARSFGALGARALVLTNAAGGLVADWPVPCLMRIVDHLNMQGVSPLAGGEGRAARVYDAAVGDALDAAGRAAGVELRAGVYAGLAGPSYETPAEIRMLAGLPAHAVGMSTVLEAMAAAAAGVRVGAISCITNPGAGIAAAPLDHAEVVEAGARIADDFARLLRAAVPAVRAASDRT
ncbi:MAG: purine-nucleoside phosphorylase [Planctomycetota bacterium]